MHRLFFVLLIFIACGGGNPPPVRPPPVRPQPQAGAFVDLTNGGRGYLVTPSGEGKHAALIVIQEWWGLNDWIKENAGRFAGQGYVAFAIDLYRGKVASDSAEAHELMRGLPEDRALADLEAAFAFLAARPDIDAARIGSIGWCMGGGYSLALAVSEPKLRAAAINYGRLVTAPEKIDAVHASLLGNFAGADRGIPPDDVRKLEGELKTRKKDADFKIYDGKGHAFMNPKSESYDAAASADAWSRIDAFFAAQLK